MSMRLDKSISPIPIAIVSTSRSKSSKEFIRATRPAGVASRLAGCKIDMDMIGSSFRHFVFPTGIEPVTNYLKRRRSTTELREDFVLLGVPSRTFTPHQDSFCAFLPRAGPVGTVTGLHTSSVSLTWRFASSTNVTWMRSPCFSEVLPSGPKYSPFQHMWMMPLRLYTCRRTGFGSSFEDSSGKTLVFVSCVVCSVFSMVCFLQPEFIIPCDMSLCTR